MSHAIGSNSVSLRPGSNRGKQRFSIRESASMAIDLPGLTPQMYNALVWRSCNDVPITLDSPQVHAGCNCTGCSMDPCRFLPLHMYFCIIGGTALPSFLRLVKSIRDVKHHLIPLVFLECPGTWRPVGKAQTTFTL